MTRDDLSTLAVESIKVETFDYNYEDTRYGVNDDRRYRLMLERDGQRGGEVHTIYNPDETVFSKTITDWVYDAENRLTTERRTEMRSDAGISLPWSDNSYTTTYVLDRVGNRLGSTTWKADGTKVTTSATFNVKDQIVSDKRSERMAPIPVS